MIGPVRERQLADDRPHHRQYLLALSDQRVPGLHQQGDHLGQVVNDALVAPELLKSLARHRFQLDVGRHILPLTPGHLGTGHADPDPDDTKVEVFTVGLALPHPRRSDGSGQRGGRGVEPAVVGVHAVRRLVGGVPQHVQHQHELGAHRVQFGPAHLLVAAAEPAAEHHHHHPADHEDRENRADAAEDM